MYRWFKYFLSAENIGLYEQIFENITVIDAHAHIGHDRDGHSMSPSELVRQMNRANIQKCIVFPLDDQKHNQDFSRPNTEILRAWKASPHRIIPFFRLNPRYNWKAEFKKRNEQGFKGIKLHPRSQNFEITGKSAMQIYEKADDAGLIVLIHAGFGVEKSSEELADITKKFPELKLIIGHSAFLDLDSSIKKLKNSKNAYFEISTVNLLDMFQILSELPHKKILYGSDIPYYDQNMALEMTVDTAIMVHKGPSQIRDILGGNMARLLKE